MDVITLEAQPRQLGSSAARRTRRADEVPCVLYGPHQEPLHFRVPLLAIRPLVYTSETHRVTLRLDGEEFDCILKDIDFHPISDQPLHADFYALTAGEEITITVPVLLVGKPVGVQEGGILSQQLNDLEVRCLPADIPGHVEIDISHLHIGDTVHVSDIEVEHVAIQTEPTRSVATITAPVAEPVEEEEEVPGLLLEGEELLGEGEGAEGAGGEPATGGEDTGDEAS